MQTGLPIEVDAEIMSGAPVFRGTRVPVQSLFDALLSGMTVDDFLDCFPTVARNDVIALLQSTREWTLHEAQQ